MIECKEFSLVVFDKLSCAAGKMKLLHSPSNMSQSFVAGEIGELSP
jgi:hypothetical protein